MSTIGEQFEAILLGRSATSLLRDTDIQSAITQLANIAGGRSGQVSTAVNLAVDFLDGKLDKPGLRLAFQKLDYGVGGVFGENLALDKLHQVIEEVKTRNRLTA